MKFQLSPNSSCPCKDCEERNPACHDRCERYKVWKKNLQDMRAEEKRYSESKQTISDVSLRKIWKKQRYQNRQHNRSDSDR